MIGRLTSWYKKASAYTVDTWRVLYPLLYAFLLIVFSYWAFVSNQQGEDFFISFVEDKRSYIYFAKSITALAAWCITLWYTTRILLRLKLIGYLNEQYVSGLIKWLPRILGVLPFLVFLYALAHASNKTSIPHAIHFYIYLLVASLIAGLLFTFYILRSDLARRIGIQLEPDEIRFRPGKTTPRELLSNHVTQWVIVGVLFVSLLIFLSFLLPVSARYAQKLKPATVLLMGFTFITVVLALFLVFTDIRRSPLGLIVFLYIILISRCNDNSSIRVNQYQELPKRETLGENLKSWLKRRLGPYSDSAKKNRQPFSVYPLVLVAAEGGGIRAMNWTAQVLQRMNEIEPTFNEHVYAISGVSGGGVGSVFYDAYYRDKTSGVFAFQRSTLTDTLFRESLGSDFLSDVTAAFMFQENLQRLIPTPVLAFNRDRRLEDSWSYSYRHSLLLKTMDEPFLELWNCDTALRYYVPNLIINGVLAESGQKAITSNLALREDSSRAFEDEIDVLQTLGYDIPLKTAASLCSRFPLITSGGLLKRLNGAPMGHVVDGGYKENTGIETVWQLMVAMRPYIQEAQDSLGVAIPVYLLFIQNSPDPRYTEKDSVNAMKTVPDLSTILSGFINSWDRRTPTFKRLSLKVLNESRLKSLYGYFNIPLDRDRGQLPLGWYLSDTAKQNIRSQAVALDSTLAIVKAIRF